MTQTEKLLFALESAAYRAGTAEAKRIRMDALQAVQWYVVTARASPAWIRSALNTDPEKFLDYIGTGSIQDQVNKATKYLKEEIKS